jgi:hypothetical protein
VGWEKFFPAVEGTRSEGYNCRISKTILITVKAELDISEKTLPFSVAK